MGIRDWFRRKKTAPPTSSSSRDSTFGLPQPKETVLTEIARRPTPVKTTPTPTTSRSSSGGSSGSSSRESTFGLPEPEETVLTEIARRPTPVMSEIPIKEQIRGAFKTNRGFAGTESAITAATGKERFTEREFTEKKFKDPSPVPQFGTQTQQFGGFTPEGEEIRVDTGFETFGEQQLKRDIKNLKIEARQKSIQDKYIKNTEKELVKDIASYSKKITKDYQSQLNAGYFTEAQANELLNKDLENYQATLLNSKKYKDFERKANIQLKQAGVGRQAPIKAIFEQKSRRERIIEQAKLLPLVGSAISAAESTGEFFEEGRKVELFESLTGEKASREGLKAARGRSIVDVGLLALDVGLTTAAAKTSIKVARGAIQRELAKGTSLSLEQLGKAKIRGISIVEKSTGEFVMKGTQQAGKTVRKFEVGGKLVKGTKGYSFVPEGEGRSVIVGLTEANLGKGLRGAVKKQFAKAIGSPTRELFVIPETFSISGAGVSRELPQTIGGFTQSRSTGIGVFQPKARTYGKVSEDTISSLNRQLASNIELGGSPVVSTFSTPAFSVDRKGAIISRQTSKQADILGILYEPVKKTPTVSFVKDEAKVLAGRKKFVDGLKQVKQQPKSLDVFDEILGTGKPTKKAFKPTSLTQSKTDVLTDTLSGGFAKTKSPVKPFSFRGGSPDLFSKSIIGVAGRGIAIGAASKVGVGAASKVGVGSLSSQLFGSANLAKASKLSQGITTASVLSSLSFAPTSSSFFRQRYRPSRFDSDFLRSQYKPKKKTKKKKKQKFKPEQTGFGVALGIKSKARKGQKFTGFEVLR